jgi:hypothetical protein
MVEYSSRAIQLGESSFTLSQSVNAETISESDTCGGVETIAERIADSVKDHVSKQPSHKVNCDPRALDPVET